MPKNLSGVGRPSNKLHIFTDGGRTFTFLDVTILVNNESTLVFEYGAQSDGATKHGSFDKHRIVGHSISS